jgi:hypothetical protein
MQEKRPILDGVIKAEKVEIVVEVQLVRRLHKVYPLTNLEVTAHTRHNVKSTGPANAGFGDSSGSKIFQASRS